MCYRYDRICLWTWALQIGTPSCYAVGLADGVWRQTEAWVTLLGWLAVYLGLNHLWLHELVGCVGNRFCKEGLDILYLLYINKVLSIIGSNTCRPI